MLLHFLFIQWQHWMAWKGGLLGSPVDISTAVGGGTLPACSSTMSLLPSASSGASGGGRSKEWLLLASSMSSGVGGGFLHCLLLTYKFVLSRKMSVSERVDV